MVGSRFVKAILTSGSQQQGKVVGMIGDGINDAPTLANANIGIVMWSGSSVAMESTDVVIIKMIYRSCFIALS